jgi:hypothetical protein
LRAEILAHLRAGYPDLVVSHPIPERPELRDWPANPVEGLPEGPAFEAYTAAAAEILGVIRPDLRRIEVVQDVATWGHQLGFDLGQN